MAGVTAPDDDITPDAPDAPAGLDPAVLEYLLLAPVPSFPAGHPARDLRAELARRLRERRGKDSAS